MGGESICVLVCGGRNYRNNAVVWGKMNMLLASRGISLVVTGGASGADMLAEKWAVANDIRYVVFKPDWESYGPAAGPIRNKRMLDECKPDLVIAFPGGKGTADMVWQATHRNFPVDLVS